MIDRAAREDRPETEGTKPLSFMYPSAHIYIFPIIINCSDCNCRGRGCA